MIKRKKIILISIAILIGSYFARDIIIAEQHAAFSMRQHALIQARERTIGSAQARLRAAKERQAQALQEKLKAKPEPVTPVTPGVQPASGIPSAPGIPAALPQPPVPQASQPPPLSPALTKLTGVWQGRGILNAPDVSALSFELRSRDGVTFSGYSNFLGKHHMNPDAAILTGTAQDGAIHFKVDKNIGSDVDGCAVSSFTLTPFGVNQIVAEWKQGTCQPGKMILQRLHP